MYDQQSFEHLYFFLIYRITIKCPNVRNRQKELPIQQLPTGFHQEKLFLQEIPRYRQQPNAYIDPVIELIPYPPKNGFGFGQTDK